MEWNFYVKKALFTLLNSDHVFKDLFSFGKEFYSYEENIETCSHMMHDEHKWLRV